MSKLSNKPQLPNTNESPKPRRRAWLFAGLGAALVCVLSVILVVNTVPWAAWQQVANLAGVNETVNVDETAETDDEWTEEAGVDTLATETGVDGSALNAKFAGKSAASTSEAAPSGATPAENINSATTDEAETTLKYAENVETASIGNEADLAKKVAPETPTVKTTPQAATVFINDTNESSGVPGLGHPLYTQITDNYNGTVEVEVPTAAPQDGIWLTLAHNTMGDYAEYDGSSLGMYMDFERNVELGGTFRVSGNYHRFIVSNYTGSDNHSFSLETSGATGTNGGRRLRMLIGLSDGNESYIGDNGEIPNNTKVTYFIKWNSSTKVLNYQLIRPSSSTINRSQTINNLSGLSTSPMLFGAVRANGSTSGSSVMDASAYIRQEYASGEAYVLPTPTRSGYEFVGWWDSSSHTLYEAGEILTMTASITLYAQWTKGIEITLHHNSGDDVASGVAQSMGMAFDASRTVEWGGSLTLPEEGKRYVLMSNYRSYAGDATLEITAANRVRIFLANGQRALSDYPVPIGEQITWTADWNPSVKTLTFSANDGSSNPIPLVATDSDSGDEGSGTEIDEESYYLSGAASTVSTAYTVNKNGLMSNDSVSEKRPFSQSYAFGGADPNRVGTNTFAAVVQADAWMKTYVSPESGLVLPKPTRAGYLFKEWNTAANGTGTAYYYGQKVDTDLELYAIWVAQSNGSWVSFDHNSGDHLPTGILSHTGVYLDPAESYRIEGVARFPSDETLSSIVAGSNYAEVIKNDNVRKIYHTSSPFSTFRLLLWKSTDAGLVISAWLNDAQGVGTTVFPLDTPLTWELVWDPDTKQGSFSVTDPGSPDTTDTVVVDGSTMYGMSSIPVAVGSHPGSYADNSYADIDNASLKVSTRVANGSRYVLPTPLRPGYTFLGWKNLADGIIHNAGEVITIAADISFEAQWQDDTAEQRLIYAIYNTIDNTLSFYKSSTEDDIPITTSTSIIYRDFAQYQYNPMLNNYPDMNYEFEDFMLADYNKGMVARSPCLPWSSKTSSITKVTFANEINPRHIAQWFSGGSNIESYEYLGNLNWENVISAQQAFNANNVITGVLNFSNTEAPNLKSLRGTFASSRNVEGVILPKANSGSLESLIATFQSMASLKFFSMAGVDTSGVTTIRHFSNNEGAKANAEGKYTSLVTVNLEGVAISGSVVFERAFNGMDELVSLDLSGIDNRAPNSAGDWDGFSAMTGGSVTQSYGKELSSLRSVKLGTNWIFWGYDTYGALTDTYLGNRSSTEGAGWVRVKDLDGNDLGSGGTKYSGGSFRESGSLANVYDGSTMAGQYIWYEPDTSVTLAFYSGGGASAAELASSLTSANPSLSAATTTTAEVDGTEREVAQIVVPVGQTVTLPGQGTMGSSVAEGWCIYNEFGERIGTAGQTYYPASDLTIVGRWDTHYFDIAWVPGVVDSGSTATGYYQPGTPIYLNVAIEDGYTFNGWDYSGVYDSTTRTGFTMPSEGITVRPLVSENNYTISYHNGLSTSSTTTTSGFNTPVNLKTVAELNFSAPEDLEGWTFAGWATSASSTEVVAQDGAAVTGSTFNGISGGVDLYAVWKSPEGDAAECTSFVSGAYDTTTLTGSTTTLVVTYCNPADIVYSVDAPTPAAWSTYDFVGWRTDTTEGPAEYDPGESLTLGSRPPVFYAVYQVTQTVTTSTFHSGLNNEGVASVTSGLATYYNSGAPQSDVSYTPTPTSLAAYGWDAIGWATAGGYNPSNSATLLGIGVPLPASPASDYYAVYTRELTVSYNGNYADGGSAPTTSTVTQVLTWDANGTLSVTGSISPKANTFTRSSYQFAGWGTKDSQGAITAIASDWMFAPEATEATLSQVLYAVWEPIPFTITFHSMDGVYIDSTSYSNAQVGRLPAYSSMTFEVEGSGVSFPSQRGSASKPWKFIGWASTSTYMGVQYQDRALTSSLTANSGTLDLYAVFGQDVDFVQGVMNPTTSTIENACLNNSGNMRMNLPTLSNEGTSPYHWRALGWTATNTAHPKSATKVSGYSIWTGTNYPASNSNNATKFYACYSRPVTINYYPNGYDANNPASGSLASTTATLYYNVGKGGTPANTPTIKNVSSSSPEFTCTGYKVATSSNKTVWKAGTQTNSTWTFDGSTYLGGTSWPTSLDGTQSNVLDLGAQWVPATGITYEVHHWKQKLGGNASSHDSNNYEEVTEDFEQKTGTTGTVVDADVKTYVGFTSPSKDTTTTIAGDSSTAINYYYTRNSYQLKLGTNANTGTPSASANTGTITGSASPYRVQYGATVTLSVTPNDGYALNGWTSSATSLQANLAAGTNTFVMPAGALTMTPVVKANTFGVEYYDRGEKLTWSENSSQVDHSSHTYGTTSRLKTITELGIAPSAEGDTHFGWTFVGWSLTDGGTDVSNGNGYGNGADATRLTSTDGAVVKLYAVWSRATNVYMGGSTTADTSHTQWDANGVFSLDLPAITAIDSWTATGWRLDDAIDSPDFATTNGAALSITVNVGPNFYAVYSRTATFMSGADGATTDTSPQYRNNNSETYLTYVPSDPAALSGKGSGWTVKGWRSAANANDTAEFDPQALVPIESTAQTFYALYERALTFRSKSNNSVQTTATERYCATNPGTFNTVSFPAPATISGWTGLGWRDDKTAGAKEYGGSSATNVSNYTGATTIYAVYSRTATFHSGIAGATTKTATKYFNASKRTLVAVPSGNTTSLGNSWSHIGWRTDTTASDKQFNATGNLTTTTYNASSDYYAVYSRTGTVAYDGNKGSGDSDVSGAVDPQTFTQYYNTNGAITSYDFILPEDGFQRVGYHLYSWSTSNAWPANGHPTSESPAGQTALGGTYTYNQGVSDAATVPMYAVWDAIDYYITFSGDDGTDGASVSGQTQDQTLTYDKSDALNANGFSRADSTVTFAHNSSKVWDGDTTATVGSTSLTASYAFGGWTVDTQANALNATPTYTNQAQLTNTQKLALSVDSTHRTTFYAVWTSAGITLPTASWTGRTFQGWYNVQYAVDATRDSANFVGNANANYKPTKGMNLHAAWTENTYGVTFHPNTGSGTQTADTTTYKYSDEYTFPAVTYSAPTGKHFTGWAAGSTSGTVYQPSAVARGLAAGSTASDTLNLYATWDYNAYTVTFEYNQPDAATSKVQCNNADASASNKMDPQSFVYNTPQNLNSCEYTLQGWHFLGWSESSTATTAAYTNGQSMTTLGGASANNDTVTLYAVWAPNDYTVTFAQNKPGGDSGASSDVAGTTANKALSYDTSGTLTANGYSLKGWTFGGWNSKADGTGTSYANGATIGAAFGNLSKLQNASVKKDDGSFTAASTDNDTVTLYARWTANTYTVAYNGNPESGMLSNTMTNDTFTYDTRQNLKANAYANVWRVSFDKGAGTLNGGATVAANPITSARTFQGWALTSTGDVKYGNSAVIGAATSNPSKTKAQNAAVLKSDGTTFAGQSASGDTTTLYARWSADGTAFALPTTVNATLTGYTFYGWSTTSLAKGVTTGAGTYVKGANYLPSSAKTEGGNPTLHATWAANTYSVTYDANQPADSVSRGDSVTNMPSQPEANSFTYDSTTDAVTSTQPALSGYTFLGWSANAAATSADYAAGALVSTHGSSILKSDGSHVAETADDGAVTLYAVWSLNSYDVTVNNLTSGSYTRATVSGSYTPSGGSAISYTPGSATATPYTATISLSAALNPGYVWSSWNVTGTGASAFSGYLTQQTFTSAPMAAGTLVFTPVVTLQNYTITWVSGVNSGETSTPAGVPPTDHQTGETFTVESSPFTVADPTRTGYAFNEWSVTGTGLTKTDNGATSTFTPNLTNPSGVTITANWTPNTNTSYTVYHKYQALDDSYPSGNSGGVPTAPEEPNHVGGYYAQGLTGTTDTLVTPSVIEAAGFTSPSATEVKISADGSRTVTYQYSRNSYTFKVASADEHITVSASPATATGGSGASVKYGTPITATATPAEGYSFTGWTAVGATGHLTDTGYTSPTADDPSIAAYTSSFRMPAGDLTLTANSTANTYTVQFDGNYSAGSRAQVSGGISNQTWTYAQAHQLPSSGFTRPGYMLDGWAEVAGGPKVYELGQQNVPDRTSVAGGTVTYYAHWTPITYTLTVASNEEANTHSPADLSGVLNASTRKTATTHEFTIEDTTVTLGQPTRHGYAFTSWTKVAASGCDGGALGNADGNGTRTFTPSDTTPSNVTFTAEWTINGAYGITYVLGETGDDPVTHTGYTPGSFTVEDQDIVISDPTRPGYAFGGWSLNNGALELVSTGDGTRTYRAVPASLSGITLTAQWVSNSYTVAFSSADAAGNGATNLNGGSDADVMGSVTYTYNLGRDDGNGGTVAALPANAFKREYAVSFVDYHGDGASVESPLVAYTEGTSAWAFLGWNRAESAVNASASLDDGSNGHRLTTTPNDAVTLHAVWSNENAGASVALPTRSQVDGYTVSGQPTNVSKTGYHFNGWRYVTSYVPYDPGEPGNAEPTPASVTLNDTVLNADSLVSGASTSVIPGVRATGGDGTSTVDLPVSGLTFAVDWEPNSYTVQFDVSGITYDTNGTTVIANSRTTAAGSIGNLVYTYDQSYYLPSYSSPGDGNTALARPGYTFEGWYQDDDTTNVITDGQQVSNLTAVENGTVVLHARWKAVGYTLTLNGVSGSHGTNGVTWGNVSVAGSSVTPTDLGGEQKSVGFTVEQTVVVGNPSVVGWTFGGWTPNVSVGSATAGNGAWTYEPSASGPGNVTLSAAWTANQYRLVFDANVPSGAVTLDGSGTNAYMDVTYDDAGYSLPACATKLHAWQFATWVAGEGADAVDYGYGATNVDPAFAVYNAESQKYEIALHASWTAKTDVSSLVTVAGSSPTLTFTRTASYLLSGETKTATNIGLLDGLYLEDSDTKVKAALDLGADSDPNDTSHTGLCDAPYTFTWTWIANSVQIGSSATNQVSADSGQTVHADEVDVPDGEPAPEMLTLTVAGEETDPGTGVPMALTYFSQQVNLYVVGSKINVSVPTTLTLALDSETGDVLLDETVMDETRTIVNNGTAPIHVESVTASQGSASSMTFVVSGADVSAAKNQMELLVGPESSATYGTVDGVQKLNALGSYVDVGASVLNAEAVAAQGNDVTNHHWGAYGSRNVSSLGEQSTSEADKTIPLLALGKVHNFYNFTGTTGTVAIVNWTFDTGLTSWRNGVTWE